MKGWKKVPKPDIADLTEEKVTEFLTEMFNRAPQQNSVVMYQRCLTYGVVDRASIDNKLCDNPQCSCVDMKKALKDAADNFLLKIN